MNTYKWVEPEGVDVLTLQKNNDPILQITKEGGLYAPAALFTSLPMDTNLEGGIMVINEKGVVMASPVTLKAMADAINLQLGRMNDGIKASIVSIEKQVVNQLNKAVDGINSNLLAIQANMIARSIPEEDLKNMISQSERLKSSPEKDNVVVEGRENYDDHIDHRYRRLERMILLLFVLFAFLFILIATIGFMSSKSKK